MKNRVRTVVITSKKNFSWLSMQEIIPYIEQNWLSLISSSHDVELINIDNFENIKKINKFIDVDNIVCTCFSVEIFNFLKFLRTNLSFDFKGYFYIHGLATIALWPFIKWTDKNFFKKSDRFIVSCQADEKCIETALPGAKVVLHPFFVKNNFKLKNSNDVKDFIYIGRISVQKNIHLIIEAVKLIEDRLRANNSSVILVGGNDNLGVPVTGRVVDNYMEHLESLIDELEVGDIVQNKGHYERSKFNQLLGEKRYIYIGVSLHSDENFGIVPFKFLNAGGRAILSQWGGYQDLARYFDGNVSEVTIYREDYGAFIRVEEVAMAMLAELEGRPGRKVRLEDDFHSIALGLFDEVSDEALSFSSFAKKILEKREKFYIDNKINDRNYGAQIFSGFDDEDFHKISYVYGKINQSKKIPAGKNLLVRSCVEVNDNEIIIHDIHKGVFMVRRVGEKRKFFSKTNSSQVEISLVEAQRLWDLGYLTYVL
ncbi:glycosyltransferase [Bacteriovoracaceae bacterium]|nr:glycosyltransferase [Bacteriovoracaceae bacterium]